MNEDNNYYDFIPEGDEENIEFYPEEDTNEDCPYLNIITALLLQDRPLGILWNVDKMIEFLKARGYRILDRKDSDGNDYTVAVKPSDNSIPDNGVSNIKEVFDNEIQDILMKWVLKISTEV
jgi:hypothetical protein